MEDVSFEDLEAKVFKDITRDGFTASAKLQKQCFIQWSSGYPGGYAKLAFFMFKAEPVETDNPYPYNRVAGALVQKLRKADLITRHGRMWHLKKSGSDFRDYLKEKEAS